MATTSKKMMITDVFVNGAFQGWNIATHSTIPNVLMAFVIIKMLNISGALDFIGTCLGPVMAIFGLPGEAAMILLGYVYHAAAFPAPGYVGRHCLHERVPSFSGRQQRPYLEKRCL